MEVLGVRPLAGRWFEAADSLPNAEPVVILSWELWQRSFGGSGTIVGQQITVNNVSRRVVGIMPRGYDVHDQKIEIWRPITIDPSTFPNNRGSHGYYLVGRLKPGATHDAGALGPRGAAQAVGHARAQHPRSESDRRTASGSIR